MTAMLVACAATASEEPESESEATEEAVRIRQGGNGVTTKGELEGKGYTCTVVVGTWTHCWKNGEPSYDCDPSGNCIPTKPKSTSISSGGIVAPAPTLLAPR